MCVWANVWFFRLRQYVQRYYMLSAEIIKYTTYNLGELRETVENGFDDWVAYLFFTLGQETKVSGIAST